MLKESQYILIDSEILNTLIAQVELLKRKIDAIAVAIPLQNSEGEKQAVIYTKDIMRLFNINNDRVSIWISQGKLRKINPDGIKHSMFDRDEVYAMLEKETKKKHEKNSQVPKRRNKISKYGVKQLNV